MIDFQLSEGLPKAQKQFLRALLPKPKLLRWARHAIRFESMQNSITIRVVDAVEARALNSSYRGKDYATNVLTFDYQKKPFLSTDLVLCAPVIEQEARAQGKPPQAHWAHLIIHGLLHAQGYDHETNERDALEMEALEVLLMLSLGFPNPY